MKKAIIFSHGDKGGVGKSTVAATITDLLLAGGKRVAIVEGDVDNADVARRFEKVSSVQIARIRLADFSEHQTAVNALFDFVHGVVEGDTADAIVVNLPASASSTIDREAELLSGILESIEINRRVVISAGNTRSAFETIQRIHDTGLASFCKSVVLAPGFMKDEGLAQKLRAAGFKSVATFPRLPPDTMGLMLDAAEHTFSAMVCHTGPIRSPIQRIRIGHFLRDARVVLNPVIGDLLGDEVVVADKVLH